jgi:hypothetical protein
MPNVRASDLIPSNLMEHLGGFGVMNVEYDMCGTCAHAHMHMHVHSGAQPIYPCRHGHGAAIRPSCHGGVHDGWERSRVCHVSRYGGRTTTVRLWRWRRARVHIAAPNPHLIAPLDARVRLHLHTSTRKRHLQYWGRASPPHEENAAAYAYEFTELTRGACSRRSSLPPQHRHVSLASPNHPPQQRVGPEPAP